MAVGKNKRLTKGKKGSKKKAADPFLKKEWYKIKAPTMFNTRSCGNTLVNKTAGTKISSEQLKGRVLEINLADLNADEDQSHRKVKLVIEETQGRDCLTHFHGMCLTRDKLCSLIRKAVTMVECNVDCKTTDGYIVRVFVIAFTKRQDQQVKANCYAQSALVKRIRMRMVQILTSEITTVTFAEFVKKLIAESMSKQIEKSTKGIFPLKDTMIRKVKVLKKPKFDVVKFREVHDMTSGGGGLSTSEIIARVEDEAEDADDDE
eukprot:NODE_14100_length_1128_cov_10.185814.p1 GENE.NODE_14100_length_1128_cov_10.185814~~NODE_14100_length_1128_cov_10.185814.p1  ORF type:complete len:262 (-),score=93.18 NODE_14100_length_1128_cov_10.185814:253-1038(-)